MSERVYCTADGKWPEKFKDVLLEINSEDVTLGYLCEKDDEYSIWGFYDRKPPKVGYTLDAQIYWKPLTSLKDEYERQHESEDK